MTPTITLFIICIILIIWNLWLSFAIHVLHHYQNSMERELKTSIGLTDIAVSILVNDSYENTDEFAKKADELFEKEMNKSLNN